MNDSIWQSIAATPWWTYAFILFLIYYAYRRSKPHLVSIAGMILGNGLLILFSAIGIYMLVHLNITNILWWIGMYMLGLGSGWLYLSTLNASIVKNGNLLLIPGSFITMIAILASIAASFFIPFEFSFDVNLLKAGFYSRPLVVMYGLVMGLAVGRIAYILRAVKYGPYTTPEALPVR